MIKKGAMYEHNFGGTVFVTKVTTTTVEFRNQSIPDMEFHEKDEWKLETFIEQFSYVAG
ncbi:hypothetical protein [Bacillus thuringiensis]|uniref:hypothetical protein n=1 Tax=Bacillus thuringiensis TaxID=1428 RepID=UPI0037C8FEC4